MPLDGLNLIFHSVRPGGGMERHVLDLAAAITRRNIPLRIITRRLEWPSPCPTQIEFVVLPDRTPFARFNNYRFEATATRHCNANWPTIGISRVPSGATLAIAGGTHRGHLKNKGKSLPSLFDLLTIRHEQALYDSARAIVAHSEQVRQEIIKHYQINPNKTITLYPPVDTTTFSLAARNDRNTLRQQLGITPNQLLLLFPSNNHTLKGADLIISALEGFDPRVRLVVAGKAKLDHPSVINLGFRTDMAALYAAADATILASKYEAFGLVGPESVLCGTPVLFADTVGAIEILSEQACIRFSRSVASLRTALSHVLERFIAKTLALATPDSHILYPYSIDAHLDLLIEQLQS